MESMRGRIYFLNVVVRLFVHLNRYREGAPLCFTDCPKSRDRTSGGGAAPLPSHLQQELGLASGRLEVECRLVLARIRDINTI